MSKRKGIDPNFDYKKYWEDRYAKGGHSGKGSYGENRKFKAMHVNRVMSEYKGSSISDFGCGDGSQHSLFPDVPYFGYDISPTIIKKNQDEFSSFSNKSFEVIDMNTPDKYFNKTDISICFDCLLLFCWTQSFFSS